MVRPTDLVIVVLVVSAVVWLNVPRLLLPAVALALVLMAAYRWRRESHAPFAAERYRWQLVASCVLIAAISIPLILGVVPPNGVYGFRTSVTRSSPAIWYPANRFLGWALLVAAAASARAVTTLPATARRHLFLLTFLGPVLLAVLVSFLYLRHIA